MLKKRAVLWLLASTAATISGTANAQQAAAGSIASDSNANIADIIVTAQKRTERLTDVPMSITAVTGEQLLRQGVTSATDLGRVTTGFSYQTAAYDTPIFTIRGIGLYDNFFGVSPTVTVYVDQAPLPYLSMTKGAGLDIERVEVLKGPQGTLFGQNSTGGAINYIAAKPTDDAQMGFDLTYGRFDQVDAQAFVSGPLSSTLKARVAVRHESRGDWQYSLSRPGDELGQRDFTAARLLLDWTPVDSVRFELNANAWWDQSDTQAGQFRSFVALGAYPEAAVAIGDLPQAPERNRAGDWDAGANLRRDDHFKQVSLRGDFDLSDELTLTSITSYADLRLFIPTDIDGTAFNDYSATQAGSAETFFQEVRLAGKINDRIRFTVGGNYGHDDIRGNSISSYMGSNTGVGPFRFSGFAYPADQKVRTLAGFGALDYELTDQLTLQVSGRYTDQERDFRGCLNDTGAGDLAAAFDLLQFLATGISDPAPAGGCVTLDSATNLRLQTDYRDSLSENNFSWRGSLNWKPSDDTLLYANVTKGYKSGTFTQIAAIFTSQLAPVNQESVLAYEAGFKASLLNRRIQVSGAGFYYDYQNKQVVGTEGSLFGQVPTLKNVPKATAYGAELEVTLRPVDGLRVMAGGTYVHTKVDQAPSGIFSNPSTGVPIDIQGESFPNTPKWQFVGDAEYEFALSPELNGFLGGGASYRSSTPVTFGMHPDFQIDGYTLVDLRAGIAAKDDKWRLQVWGRNVFNKYYWTGALKAVDTTVRWTGMPATYGVTLSTRF